MGVGYVHVHGVALNGASCDTGCRWNSDHLVALRREHRQPEPDAASQHARNQQHRGDQQLGSNVSHNSIACYQELALPAVQNQSAGWQ